MVPVPRDQYAAVATIEADYWRVNTKGGRTYAVKRLAIADSTLIIQEEVKARVEPVSGRFDPVRGRLPYAIPLSEVLTVETADYQDRGASVLVIAALVSMAMFFYVGLWLSDLSDE
jgi:hypothetical protein